jgi:hypothetical protein
MSILEFLGVKPTLPKFASRLANAFPPEDKAQWRFDAAKGALLHAGGSELSLQNMFLEYASNPSSARSGLIRKYAALAYAHTREIPDLWIQAACDIIPTIRSRFVESTVAARCRAEGTSLDALEFPFAGDLRIRLMYDFGDYMGYVKAAKLQTWGQPRHAVLERATANLGQMQTPTWNEVTPGVFKLSSPGSFEESLIQLDSVVRMLPFAADAALMPCNRGILLAADSRSVDAVESMLLEAEKALDSPWPMSSTMCRRTSDGWTEFQAPERCANLAHGLAVRHLAEFYSAQKAVLDEVNETRGRDLYVAEYSVVRIDDIWQSYCVWSEGVPSLLPVPDWVAILPEGDDSEHIRVPWKDVVEICGARMAATEDELPRFEVHSFPDAAEWAALQARSLT